MARSDKYLFGLKYTILLDVTGTPSFDFHDTKIYEGGEIDVVKDLVSSALESLN